ncbi:electron transfer flavoprotein subunit alpha [Acidiplasma aeolicum]|uniref:Electron transfer flavoprotein subunit alpha n=1 Tax=Acidiplasma aeolicum TaxID=507754 RepID=A0A0P9D437_9ARCH|nr:electron transfer flavoprotein subunit alpha/FixB family protein [Acidiplasma aeolicum]KPV47457.1 electron transfer flavoprotein subunit alpha [Acidiplasma aeolicum]
MRGLLFSDIPKNAGEMASYFSKKMDIDIISIHDESVLKYGASKVYFYDSGFSDNLSDAIIKLNDKNKYDFIFISSTVLGREIAGILSARTGMKCLTEIFYFENNDKIITKRLFYGGKTVMEESSDFHLFTVAPGISSADTLEKISESENLQLQKSIYEIKSRLDKNSGGEDISDAKIIVSIGRGVGSKENIQKIEPLVNILHAKLAGSRPVCLDYKWLSEDQQVGLSGKKVRPDFYIALGISGQIQHIAGIRGAKTVIAINKDKTAPIFDECDYGIVDDLFSVVDKLVNELKK